MVRNAVSFIFYVFTDSLKTLILAQDLCDCVFPILAKVFINTSKLKT